MAKIAIQLGLSAAATSTALASILGGYFALLGCSAPAETVKAPEPTPVVWKQQEADSAAASDEADEKIGPNEVELDAPGAGKAEAAKEPEKEQPEAAPRAEKPEKAATEDASEDELADEDRADPAPGTPLPPLAKEMRAAVEATQPKPKPGAKKPPAPKPEPEPEPEPAGPKFKGANPCTAERFSIPRVEEACANGGRAAAKGVMKEAVSRALAAGASLKCNDCHANQRDYALKKGAADELKKWLGS